MFHASNDPQTDLKNFTAGGFKNRPKWLPAKNQEQVAD